MKKSFITEAEAVKICSISANTLKKFAEVGCIETKLKEPTTGDESIDCLYEKAGLLALLGITDVSDKDETNEDSYRENFTEATSASIRDATITDSDVSETASIVENTEMPGQLNTNNNVQSDDADEVIETHKPAAKNRLSSLVEVLKMQDQILTEKDAMIRTLEQQNSWLRQRIEKAEETAEREQMVLMSQAKTIQDLAKLQDANSRKGPIRGLLEYMGFTPQKNIGE